MAVWQVDFYLVPQRALATAPRPLAPATMDDTAWWASTPFPADYRVRLGAVAPVRRSRSEDMETWGDEEGNRVDVWSDGGRVRNVMVRVDVRRLDPRFGAALLVFVRAANGALVRRDGLVVEATINAYSGALRSSSAWRYVSDPIAWLAAQVASNEDAE